MWWRFAIVLPIKIELINLGKVEKEYRSVIEEYERRIARLARVRYRQDGDIPEGAVLLDPRGKEMSSEEFYEFLSKNAKNGRKMIFVIGPPEGFDDLEGHEAISLSKLTFRHELAYLILLEQIYRALLKMKGTNYEK